MRGCPLECPWTLPARCQWHSLPLSPWAVTTKSIFRHHQMSSGCVGRGCAEGTCSQLRAIWTKRSPTIFSIVHKWVQWIRESPKTQFWIVRWLFQNVFKNTLSNYLGSLYYTFLSKSSGPLESPRTGVRGCETFWGCFQGRRRTSADECVQARGQIPH